MVEAKLKIDPLDYSIHIRSETKQTVKEAENSYKQMEISIANFQQSDIKTNKKSQLKQYKKQLEHIKRMVKQFEEEVNHQNQKQQLFGDNVQSFEIESRESMLYMKQNDELMDAKKSLYDSEMQAIEMKREMHDQSNKLQNTISKVKGIYGNLSISHQVISEMQRRIMKNKVVYYLIILLVLTMFLAIVYQKLI